MLRTLATAVTLLISTCQIAWAEIQLGRIYPRTVFPYCSTLSAAGSQARLSALQSKERVYREPKPEFVAPNCKWVEAIVKPIALEHVIEPFLAWAPQYDPAGSDSSTAKWDGETHVIHFEMAKQRVAVYRAEVVTNEGVRQGWVELPDEPYTVTFLRLKKKP